MRERLPLTWKDQACNQRVGSSYYKYLLSPVS